ncbi:MAG TPA: vWA domain-containing protein, partial [Gemmataceae bacterium]|nr:vWA domain-containing protein [Gemmataceae bacterium]
VKLDLLYRGWVVAKTVEADYAGTPVYEWIYTPPKSAPQIAVRGDEALRDGAVAFLIDASASMANREKYAKTIDALRALLTDLPAKTMVSVHYFAGTEGPNGELTPVLPPTIWNNPPVQAQMLHAKLRTRDLNGDVSPISAAIRNALEGETVFAKAATGHRSLIVLTDGAENTNQEDPKNPTPGPGENVLKKLKEVQAKQDVALHLMLIGVSPAGYASARVQFGAMEDANRSDLPGTLPTIWPRHDPKNPDKPQEELKETDDLRRIISESMLPRIIVRRPNGEVVATMPVSIPDKDLKWVWRTLPLPRDSTSPEQTFQISLARARTTGLPLLIAPGDRMTLSLKQDGKGNLAFVLPSYADARVGLGWLDRVNSDPERLVMTVARNFLTPNGSDYDLEMTATLENPLVKEGALGAGLRRKRPAFVWFDVAAQGGAEGPRRIRVENLHDRFAPAWQVRAGPWVPGAGGKDVTGALPARVTGYWLDAAPTDSDPLFLKTARTTPTPDQKVRRVGGKEITIRNLEVTDTSFRIDLTHEPKFPVVVRLGLKGPNQPWTVSEHHLFFDNGQYTARFEGISPEDLEKEVTLDFYLIDGANSVKARAIGDKTKLTVDVKLGPDPREKRDLLPVQTDLPR